MITGKKVLIVDDDPQVVTSLGTLFKNAGAVVASALSYDEGLAALAKEKPDAAIIDLLLPHHSGLELVAEARKQPGAQPFFVILTNSINAEHIADAMESDVTMFVQKADHDPSEIVEMVTKRFE